MSRSANAEFKKNSEGATVRQPNTEGAVAKSASGDSPLTQGRLDYIQRYNLPLLAGGDCADWRLISVKPKSDHANHRARLEVQANATNHHRQTADRK